MGSRSFTLFPLLLIAVLPYIQAGSTDEISAQSFDPSSPFSTALETLQKQLNYSFESVGLLRRAMTHASYSEENNRALGVLGVHVIETSIAMRYLVRDIEMSSKELNHHISEISRVETSCAADGVRLGIQKVVRVSPKTNSSSPAVVCGAFRAVFGAIALDTGKSDQAGNVFFKVHHALSRGAVAM